MTGENVKIDERERTKISQGLNLLMIEKKREREGSVRLRWVSYITHVSPTWLRHRRWWRTRCHQSRSNWCGGKCQGTPPTHMCGPQSSLAGPAKKSTIIIIALNTFTTRTILLCICLQKIAKWQWPSFSSTNGTPQVKSEKKRKKKENYIYKQLCNTC